METAAKLGCAVRYHHRRWIVTHLFTIRTKPSPSHSISFFQNSGIGLESSLLFASEGANVLLVDINIKAAESVAALIATRYPNVKAIASKTDVGVEKEIKDVVDLAVKEFGRLDIMVRLSLSHLHTEWLRPAFRPVAKIRIRSGNPCFPALFSLTMPGLCTLQMTMP